LAHAPRSFKVCLKASLSYPLLFEPGERWDYGIGIDWLGQIVEAIDGRRVDTFCREEIFGPLGMVDSDFEPSERLAPRLAAVKIRGEDGSFADFSIAPPPNPEVYGMGHHIYSTAPDYMRFLRMLLNKGKVNQLPFLTEASVKDLLQLQASAAKVVYNPIGEQRLGYAHGAWVLENDNGTPVALCAPGLYGGWAMVDTCRGYAYLVITKNKLKDEKADLHFEIKALIDRQYTNRCQ